MRFNADIYLLICFFLSGFFVPFIFLPDFAEIQNISRRDAAFLISIIGIANTVARVGCGWIADQPWCDCLLFNNIALVMGGISTMLVPLFTNYPLLAIYSFVFGACIGKSLLVCIIDYRINQCFWIDY